MSYHYTVYKTSGPYVKNIELNDPTELPLNVEQDETAVEGTHGELTWLADDGQILTRPSVHHVLMTGEWVDARDGEEMQLYHGRLIAQYLNELKRFAENTIASLAINYRVGEDRLYALLIEDATAYLAAYDAAVAASTPLPGWGDSIELRGIARMAGNILYVEGETVDPDQQRDLVVYLLREMLNSDIVWRKRVAIIRAEVNAFQFKAEAFLYELTDQAANIQAIADTATANVATIVSLHPPALDLMLEIE